MSTQHTTFSAAWYAGNSYQSLVEEGAARVYANELPLSKLGVHSSRINKPEDEHETCLEQFRADVNAYLAEHTPETETDEETDVDEAEETNQSDGRTPADIDWPAVYAEFNFDRGEPGVSRTQLKGALAASDHTTFSHQADDAIAGAPDTLQRLIQEAVDDGYLMVVRHRNGAIDVVDEVER